MPLTSVGGLGGFAGFPCFSFQGAHKPMAVVSIQQDARAEISPDPFADFWLLYPRRVAKLAARKAWAKISPDLYAEILTTLVAWRQVWRDKDPEFLPYPATWLNGERWEDELPPAYRRWETPQIGPRTADQPAPARTPIPEHVRALLARLRGKAT